MALPAKLERRRIKERTERGRTDAKAKGVIFGRKPKLTPHQQREAINRRDRDGETLRSIARTYNVSAATIRGWRPGPGDLQCMARRGEALMPIRREYRWFYPIDWPQLSAAIRFGRAKGRCEHCRRPHGRLVFHLGDGRWWDDEAATWRNGVVRLTSCKRVSS